MVTIYSNEYQTPEEKREVDQALQALRTEYFPDDITTSNTLPLINPTGTNVDVYKMEGPQTVLKVLKEKNRFQIPRWQSLVIHAEAIRRLQDLPYTIPTFIGMGMFNNLPAIKETYVESEPWNNFMTSETAIPTIKKLLNMLSYIEEKGVINFDIANHLDIVVSSEKPIGLFDLGNSFIVDFPIQLMTKPEAIQTSINGLLDIVNSLFGYKGIVIPGYHRVKMRVNEFATISQMTSMWLNILKEDKVTT